MVKILKIKLGNKGAGERLRFRFDWLERLGGDTIEDSYWTASSDLTLSDMNFTPNGSTDLLVAGGDDGVSYDIQNTVVTTAGRILVQTGVLVIANRSVKKLPIKDNQERLDYALDYTLNPGETITDSVWTTESVDLILSDGSFTNLRTLIWTEGGIDGQTHLLENTIATSHGRIIIWPCSIEIVIK